MQCVTNWYEIRTKFVRILYEICTKFTGLNVCACCVNLCVKFGWFSPGSTEQHRICRNRRLVKTSNLDTLTAPPFWRR